MDHITHLPPSRLAPSATNPRRSMSSEALAELTNSIRSQGILQAIIARPIVQHDIGHDLDNQAEPPTHEIVIGHRRHQAALDLGLETIPCVIQAMTDKQVLEAQLHENMERADIHPIDEGDAFRALIDQHGHTPETIAESTGKSRSYVYARIKLARDLCEPVRQRCRLGHLDTETAALIASIPSHKLQIQAAATCEAMPYRQAKVHIASTFHTDLRHAAGWDLADPTLIESAGPCTTCRHRSGNDPSDSGGNPDVCTSPDCFNAKRMEHVRRTNADRIDCEFEQPADAYLGHFAADTLCSAHRRSWSEMLNHMVNQDFMTREAANSLTTTALLRVGRFMGKPEVIQLISHVAAQTIASEFSRYLGILAQRNAQTPASEGAGVNEVETSVATPRDRSDEEPSLPLVSRKSDGNGDGAGSRRHRIVRGVLRDRGERTSGDLLWICRALAYRASHGTRDSVGLPPFYLSDDADLLMDRSPDELGRIALACAIDTVADWIADDEELDEVLRLGQMRFCSDDAEEIQTDDAGLTAVEDQTDEVSAPPVSTARSTRVRYRNPDTGETWSGRGLQPAWLRHAMDAGRSLDEFEVRSRGAA